MKTERRGVSAEALRAEIHMQNGGERDDGQGRLAGQATIEGSSRGSTWARGQSWAMLGLAQAAHLAGGEFSATAARVADWYLDHVPADNVCFWDFDDPTIPDAPRDTSATASQLIWGDYFLLEALLALDGVIKPGTL